jgi:signal transduction histidine kinase
MAAFAFYLFALTTLAGGLFGFLASRRVLVPLRNVGLAAEAIAGGQLDTRLTSGEDRDLDPLVASFNDMAAALEERIERDTRFASEVSHELRSPLMTMAASVEVLSNSRDELNDRARTALDLMYDDVGRFRQLVEDLLEISRVDVGAVTLHLAPVIATELVIQAVSTSNFGSVPVRYDPDVADVGVMVDKVRFFRAIENLLGNAANYAEGATSVDITLHRATDEPAMVHIAVQDGGPGVPVEEREVIFDRFSRGREGGNRGSDSGTGLGLALVDEHIRLHHGRVWVDDRSDGLPGARFVIELPAMIDSDDDSDQTEGTYSDQDYGLDVVRPDDVEPTDATASNGEDPASNGEDLASTSEDMGSDGAGPDEPDEVEVGAVGTTDSPGPDRPEATG